MGSLTGSNQSLATGVRPSVDGRAWLSPSVLHDKVIAGRSWVGGNGLRPTTLYKPALLRGSELWVRTIRVLRRTVDDVLRCTGLNQLGVRNTTKWGTDQDEWPVPLLDLMGPVTEVD